MLHGRTSKNLSTHPEQIYIYTMYLTSDLHRVCKTTTTCTNSLSINMQHMRNTTMALLNIWLSSSSSKTLPFTWNNYTYDYKLLNKRNPYLTSVAYYLDFGNCNPHYLVPNCSAINLEYITRNLVKIKQLCLSIRSARYRGGGGGGMVPKVALSYHWITLVKTLILDYTLILLPQYINNGLLLLL